MRPAAACARLPLRAAAWALLAASSALPAVVLADPVGVVNALRADGCSRVPAAGSPARRHSALDAAARQLARSAKLADALGRVGYPAAKSASFHVRGPHDDAAIRGALEPRYCESVNDPKLVEVGVHQSGDDVWIVMAGRTELQFTALLNPAGVAQRVLELVNAARA